MNNTIAYIIALAILTPVVIIGAVIALNNTDQEPITQQPIKVQNQRVQTIALQEPEQKIQIQKAGAISTPTPITEPTQQPTKVQQPKPQTQTPKQQPVQEQEPTSTEEAQSRLENKLKPTGMHRYSNYEQYYGVKGQKNTTTYRAYYGITDSEHASKQYDYWVFRVGNKEYHHKYIDKKLFNDDFLIIGGVDRIYHYRQDGTLERIDRLTINHKRQDWVRHITYYQADGITKKLQKGYRESGSLWSTTYHRPDGTERLRIQTGYDDFLRKKYKHITYYREDGTEQRTENYSGNDSENQILNSIAYYTPSGILGLKHYYRTNGTLEAKSNYQTDGDKSIVVFTRFYREDGTLEKIKHYQDGGEIKRTVARIGYYDERGTALVRTEHYNVYGYKIQIDYYKKNEDGTYRTETEVIRNWGFSSTPPFEIDENGNIIDTQQND